MARPTIDQIRQMGDFLTMYRWDVIITGPRAVSGLPNSEKMNFRCETSEVPKVNGQSMEVNVRGHKIKQPGIYNYDNVITLTFVETTDVVLHTFVKQWREALWKTKTGVAAAPKNDLMGTIVLRQLDNQDKAVWEYTLTGVYVESYDFGTLDGASSDTQKPSVTFSYDYFEDKKLA